MRRLGVGVFVSVFVGDKPGLVLTDRRREGGFLAQ